MKTCSLCRKAKPFEDFYKHSTRRDRLQDKCKDCHKKAMKEYRLINPISKNEQRRKDLRSRFGISLEQYNTLLIKQNYVCAICGEDNNVIGREFGVDHCHTTGKVRGLLCNNCNTGIGMLQDSPVLLQAAIEYLTQERHASD